MPLQQHELMGMIVLEDWVVIPPQSKSLQHCEHTPVSGQQKPVKHAICEC
jgi:hypothetical protein